MSTRREQRRSAQVTSFPWAAFGSHRTSSPFFGPYAEAFCFRHAFGKSLMGLRLFHFFDLFEVCLSFPWNRRSGDRALPKPLSRFNGEETRLIPDCPTPTHQSVAAEIRIAAPSFAHLGKL